MKSYNYTSHSYTIIQVNYFALLQLPTTKQKNRKISTSQQRITQLHAHHAILAKRQVIRTTMTLHANRNIVTLAPTYPTILLHITGVHRWDRCTKCTTPSKEKGTQHWEIEPLSQKEEKEIGDTTRTHL